MIDQMHWIDQSYSRSLNNIQAKIRYRQSHQHCCAIEQESNQWRLDFSEPQRAVTPGQYAVLYDGEHCLGGGIISQRIS